MKKFNEILLKVNSAVISFIRKYWFFIALGLVLLLAVAARIPLYTKRTGDFNNFLKPWYMQICEDPRAFLAKGDGDYTPTYMYILWFISLFKIDCQSMTYLYTLKTISVLFDFSTAFLIFWILKFILKKHDAITLIGVVLALFIPQILLNSAFWGQCDSIYSFFVVLSFFFILKKKPLWSAVVFGVAFAFKLQSIFFLPLLVLLWFDKKFRLWYFLLIPVVYIVLMIPAMLCGRSFTSCMGVYFMQADEYVYLSMNAPNIYSFMYRTLASNTSVKEELVPAATIFGLSLVLVLCIFLFLSQKDMKEDDIIKVTFLITLFVPYVLPKMHERYFYLAEVFSVLYLAINPKKWYISALAVGGTFQGYNNYLFNTYYLGNKDLNMIIGATLILAALILLCYDVFKGKSLSFKKEEAPIENAE